MSSAAFASAPPGAKVHEEMKLARTAVRTLDSLPVLSSLSNRLSGVLSSRCSRSPTIPAVNRSARSPMMATSTSSGRLSRGHGTIEMCLPENGSSGSDHLSRDET